MALDVAMILGNDFSRDNRVRREARSLGQAGHRVTVFAVQSPHTEPEEDVGPYLVVRTPLPDWAGSGSGWRGALRVARWYRRFEPLVSAALARGTPDVIHAHDLDTLEPAQRAALALGVPCIFDDHESSYVDKLPNFVPPDAGGAKGVVLRGGMRWLQRRGEMLERRARRRGLRAVITVSHSLADHVVGRFGPPQPLVLRNVPHWRAVPRSDALRKKAGVHPDDKILLYHGTVTAGRGVDAAIRSLRLLGDGYVLVVLGWAWRQSRLEELAAEEGVEDRVRFIPGVPEDEMFQLIASADVGLVPTEPSTIGYRYGIPNKFFECLMSGLPVVATDTPEVAAILRRTGAGLLYPARVPQDPAALAEGVHTMLSDPVLRDTCREKALEAAQTELNWEQESRGLLALYEEIESER